MGGEFPVTVLPKAPLSNLTEKIAIRFWQSIYDPRIALCKAPYVDQSEVIVRYMVVWVAMLVRELPIPT